MPERDDNGTCCVPHRMPDGLICLPAREVAPDGSLGDGTAYLSPADPEWAEWVAYFDRRDRRDRRDRLAAD